VISYELEILNQLIIINIIIITTLGLVQRILCDKAHQAHENACHLLEGTVCHLLEHCGDHRGRFVSCTYDYDIFAFVPHMWSHVKEHQWVLFPLLFIGPLIIILALVPELL
jgi:hypothetical protein